MKNYKIVLFILFACFMYSSCKQENNKRDDFSPDLLTESVDTLYYSAFVDSVKYIHLETSEDRLIGEINEAILTSDKIFILDKYKQTIWIFDQYGKYVDCISKRGNGPGEYVNICQIDYDKDMHAIAALDMWTKSILYYHINGDFIKKVNLEQYATNFKIVPQEGYIISNAGEAKENAGIYLADMRGKTINKLAAKKENHMLSYTDVNDFASFNDTIAFILPNFENKIYHLHHHEIELKYPFTFYPLLQNNYKENISQEHLEDFIRTKYIEGEKWLFMTFWSATNSVRNFLYSKEENKYWISKYLINDIDGVKRKEKLSASENNQFIFVCENDNPEENNILQILFLK